MATMKRRLLVACLPLLAASATLAYGSAAANPDVARFLKQVRGKRTLVIAFHPY